MKEFVFGTDDQYELLERSLEDGLCHIYSDCVYPQCCTPERGRLGFEKDKLSYVLFIDKDIRCSGKRIPSLFREWLECGALRFLDFYDLKSFLKSLDILYK